MYVPRVFANAQLYARSGVLLSTLLYSLKTGSLKEPESRPAVILLPCVIVTLLLVHQQSHARSNASARPGLALYAQPVLLPAEPSLQTLSCNFKFSILI